MILWWWWFSAVHALPATRVSQGLISAFEFKDAQTHSSAADTVSPAVLGSLTWNNSVSFLPDRNGVQLFNVARSRNETVKSSRDASALSRVVRTSSAMSLEVWLTNTPALGAALSLAAGMPAYDASACVLTTLQLFLSGLDLSQTGGCLRLPIYNTAAALPGGLLHIVVTLDGKGSFAYANQGWTGNLLMPFNFSFAPHTFLHLGMPARYPFVGSAVYTGNIHFVAIYNTCLSYTDVLQNFNAWLDNSKPYIAPGQTARVFEDRLQNISLSSFVFDFDNFAATQFPIAPTALSTPQPITLEVVAFSGLGSLFNVTAGDSPQPLSAAQFPFALADNILFYQPPRLRVGVLASVTLRAFDGQQWSDPQAVAITVQFSNHAPNANATSAVVNASSPALIRLVGWDVDNAGYTFLGPAAAITALPSHGRLFCAMQFSNGTLYPGAQITLKGGQPTWLNTMASVAAPTSSTLPAAHEFQLFYISDLPALSASWLRVALNDSFAFVLRDEYRALSSPATVSISVLNPLQPRTSPHAAVAENGNSNVQLAALDFALSDPFNTASEPLTFWVTSLPAHGRLWLSANLSRPPLTAARLPATAQNVQPGVGMVWYKPDHLVFGPAADGFWFQTSFASGSRKGFTSFASFLPIDLPPTDSAPVIVAPSSVNLLFLKQVPLWVNISDPDPVSRSNLFKCHAQAGNLGMASIFINPAASRAQPPPVFSIGDGLGGQLIIEFQATREVMALAFQPAYLQAQTEDPTDTLTITVDDQDSTTPGPLSTTVVIHMVNSGVPPVDFSSSGIVFDPRVVSSVWGTVIAVSLCCLYYSCAAKIKKCCCTKPAESPAELRRISSQTSSAAAVVVAIQMTPMADAVDAVPPLSTSTEGKRSSRHLVTNVNSMAMALDVVAVDAAPSHAPAVPVSALMPSTAARSLPSFSPLRSPAALSASSPNFGSALPGHSAAASPLSADDDVRFQELLALEIADREEDQHRREEADLQAAIQTSIEALHQQQPSSTPAVSELERELVRLYQTQLEVLHRAGFTDQRANIVKLTEFGGDVEKALDKLLQADCGVDEPT